MRLIPVQDRFAMVDDADYEALDLHVWSEAEKAMTYYARRNVLQDGAMKSLLMHRVILGLSDPNIVVDHIDGNGLNNQLSNLRVCTKRENSRNQRKRRRPCSSKYKGVSYFKSRWNLKKPWYAHIVSDHKNYSLGYYATPEEAALAYNTKAKELFGEWAKLNEVPVG
jgi:hypothetical protein